MPDPAVPLANRYRLETRLGGGGMGEVWRAIDLVLGRTVAVKVMRPQLVEQPGFAARFLSEAQAMATIKHSGVVAVYDYHSDDAGAFLVMEHVPGEALSDRLRRVGRLDPVMVMSLVVQAAEALQAAHDRGVVHRDIKPGNLLVTTDDALMLTDFGIARSAASAPLTATGAVIGTPSYLAPEQVLGHPATARSDVYSLGVVAYECLSGQRPFQGENPFDIAMRRLREPPRTLPGDVPAQASAVVGRALAVAPEQRWPSAGAMAEAARAVAAGRPSVAAPGFVTGRAPAAQADTPAPPTQIAPTEGRHPIPPRPVVTTDPAVRPVSVFAAGMLLRVSALAWAVYCAILIAAVPDVVRVSWDVLGDGWATTIRVITLAGWAAAVAYGTLALLFLLLAWQTDRRNRTARVWTFVVGLLTLLGCGPLGVFTAAVGSSLRPVTEYRRELLATIPSSYAGVTIAAGLIGMTALLVAMVLLMLPAANRYFAATRS
jgi:serine/threonine-protein kinase